MALTNAERQRNYRARRKQQEPVRQYLRPRDRRSRPERWRQAVETLRVLQAEYESWLENMPEALQDSPTAELLSAIAEIDLEGLDVELPRGFGRD
jgi:hypothetical protein